MKKTSARVSKALALVVSLIVSFCLWLYLAPDDEIWIRNIPVTLENEDALQDQQLMVTDANDLRVSLKIYGKRADITALGKNDITVKADVSKIKKAGDYSLDYEVTLPSALKNSTVSVTQETPSILSVNVIALESKTIEVKGVLDGSPADGYLAETMTYDNDEITILGPADQVDQVSYAQVVLERTNLDKTVTADVPYTLVDADGNAVNGPDITCDVTEIEVTQPIVMVKEVPLTVNLTSGGGATSDYADVSISPETVTISGDSTTLDGISQIVLGSIDLSQVDTSGEYKFSILIANGTKNLSGEETATVTVTLKGLSQKTLTATSLSVINTPAGFTSTVVTQSVDVVIRGPTATTTQVAANNLRVVADLSTLTEAGTYEVPAEIYIDGYSDEGVLGTYTLTVYLASSAAVSTDTGG